jgi:hypothetical protein
MFLPSSDSINLTWLDLGLGKWALLKWTLKEYDVFLRTRLEARHCVHSNEPGKGKGNVPVRN